MRKRFLYAEKKFRTLFQIVEHAAVIDADKSPRGRMILFEIQKQSRLETKQAQPDL